MSDGTVLAKSNESQTEGGGPLKVDPYIIPVS